MSCDYYSFEAGGQGRVGWQAEVVGDRQLLCWAGQVDSSPIHSATQLASSQVSRAGGQPWKVSSCQNLMSGGMSGEGDIAGVGDVRWFGRWWGSFPRKDVFLIFALGRVWRNTVPRAVFPRTLPRAQGVYWMI